MDKACNVAGCSNIAIARGWCDKHRKRFERHGDVLFTRASDWGAREKHPLYKTWHWLVRCYSQRGMLSKEWSSDLWKFVEDVKQKPSSEHRITRKDKEKPFSSENFYWRKMERNSGTQKEQSRRWQKKLRESDPEYLFKSSLKKYFNLTPNQYYAMHSEQNGVCKICNGKERSVDHRTKKTRRLSVDHCHATGKIRGLLCADCNRGLSSFKDNEEFLKNAICYLKEK